MNTTITHLRSALKAAADEKTKAGSQNFFKEKIQFYGVKVPLVQKMAKEYFKKLEGLNKKEIFALCDELWQSGMIEESFVACNWSYYLHKQFQPADFKVFEKWINQYVNNWASCDTLCNHTVGEFVEMFPEYVQQLKTLALSENRWARRAAAVSLIIPARRGKFLSDIFDIATLLLTDSDDLVQKGYGWMLKAASQAHQQEVFDFVMKNKAVMPRTALRYAIEKMPADLRKMAMAK
jgi:3-methyladenine DNA glycosylase AlkD